jgi:hypothetical protein
VGSYGGSHHHRLMTTTAAASASRVDRAARYAALRDPQTFTVTARGESVTFESRLSDDDAQDLLQYCSGRFARSLWEQSHERGLSERQIAWAHKLSTDMLAERQSASEDPAAPSQFEALFAAFQAARDKGAKRLTLRFAGINVKPNRAGDALWVTSQTEREEGNYGLQPKYLGKVTTNGMDSRLGDDIKAVLMEAAQDPLTAAIRYGKQSGACSCCGRELTDPRSIERGIGPICATKFGW